MTFLNTSIRKLTLFLATAMLSVSAIAMDFNQTQRLANQGNAAAQFKLALMYEHEVGVNQNYAEARKWYEKAANKGHADAQNNLGLMYNDGKGVRQNLITAKEWFGKSCDNGSQEGCDNYRRLNQR